MTWTRNGYVVLAVGLLCRTPQLAHAADSAQDALQQGIMAQTGDRDFNKAVELYRKSIALAATQPDVAARAELQLGLCYEAMNQPNDAIATYHAVIELAGSQSPDVVESARTHVQRLEIQLTAKEVPSDNSVAKEFLTRPWEFSFQGGRLASSFDYGTSNNPFPTSFDFSHAVLWADLSRKITRHWRLGAEGGDFLSGTSHSTVTGEAESASDPGMIENGQQDSKQTGYYAGVFTQVETTFLDHLHPYFRFGFGLTDLSTTVKTVGTLRGFDYYGFDYVVPFSTSYNVADLYPTLAPALGVDYALSTRISVGVGVRDLFLMSRGYAYAGSDEHSTFITHQYFVPYGRLAYRW